MTASLRPMPPLRPAPRDPQAWEPLAPAPKAAALDRVDRNLPRGRPPAPLTATIGEHVVARGDLGLLRAVYACRAPPHAVAPLEREHVA
jgi:hypothetical protein